MSSTETGGELFLGICALICIGAFLNGIRFARMTRNPWTGRKLFGQPIEGSELSLSRIKLIGIAQMIGAPLFLCFATVLSFGLLGPVEGIKTIKLN